MGSDTCLVYQNVGGQWYLLRRRAECVPVGSLSSKPILHVHVVSRTFFSEWHQKNPMLLRHALNMELPVLYGTYNLHTISA